MALDPKQQYRISTDATILRVWDKTGEYDAEDNPGGWGDPNPELDESAWFAMIVRWTEDGKVLDTGGFQAVYDSEATNDKETAVDLTFPLDGVFTIMSGYLPVSNDGSTLVQGGEIPNDTYFLWNGDVYLMVGGEATEIDLVDLVDNTDVLSVSCDDILYPLLAIKRQALYKEYTLLRHSEDGNAEDLFNRILKLREDMQGASYAFYSNLKNQACSMVDSLIDRYKIAANE